MNRIKNSLVVFTGGAVEVAMTKRRLACLAIVVAVSSGAYAQQPPTYDYGTGAGQVEVVTEEERLLFFLVKKIRKAISLG